MLVIPSCGLWTSESTGFPGVIFTEGTVHFKSWLSPRFINSWMKLQENQLHKSSTMKCRHREHLNEKPVSPETHVHRRPLSPTLWFLVKDSASSVARGGSAFCELSSAERACILDMGKTFIRLSIFKSGTLRLRSFVGKFQCALYLSVLKKYCCNAWQSLSLNRKQVLNWPTF